MIAAADPFLRQVAAENHFDIDITNDPAVLTDANLARYRLVVALQEAPFDIPPANQAALQRFIESGHGWIGTHAAGLTGRQFLRPGMPYWQWFEDFLGGVTYSPHPRYQRGTLIIEDPTHPVTRGLPQRFQISDEWYEFDRSPRSNRDNVHVLAIADESSYHQNKPLGDHPLIWSNPRYAHTIYIAIGHDPSLIADPNYQRLLRNAIRWAGSSGSD